MERKVYAVGQGWHSLVDEATERLERLGVKVLRHYEKYGTLRLDVDPEPREATIILNEIEDRSQHICEHCGATGGEVEVDIMQLNSTWIKTLCPTCFKQWHQRQRCNSRDVVENYMERHQLPEADKKKVREFLTAKGATAAYLTETELHYIDRDGIPGIIGRSSLEIQDNLA